MSQGITGAVLRLQDDPVPLLRRYLTSQTGTTAIEYCLIAGFLALAIVGGVTSVAGKIGHYFQQIAAVN